MSSKAAEARESFLRRLEQQKQQQQTAQPKDEKEDDVDVNKSNETITKDNPTVTSSMEADKKPAAKKDLTEVNPAHNDPKKMDLPLSSTSSPVPELATPPVKNNSNDDEENVLLQSIAKSCGMSELSELDDVDPSSLNLLRALTTPRIKKKKMKIGAASVKSTSHKRIYDNKIGEVIQPRSLDFGTLRDHPTTEASAAVASKGKKEERALPPLKEINVEDTHIPFKRQTSDITAVLPPKQNNASFFSNNDDDDDDDEEEDELDEMEVNTEATTMGSKQEAERIQRRLKQHKQVASKQSDKAATTPTRTNQHQQCSPQNQIDTTTLEPWQRHLFETLQSHSDLMKDIENRIDSLSDSLQDLKEELEQHSTEVKRMSLESHLKSRQQQNGWDEQEQYTPDDYPFQYSSTPPQQQQQEEGEHEQHEFRSAQPPGDEEPQLLPPEPSFLNRLFTAVTSVPLALYYYLLSTRIIRIITTFVKEAQRRNGVHVNLDINLIFKLMMACFLFGNTGESGLKQNSKKKEANEDENSLFKLLEQYRMEIFLSGALVMYLFQTGILGFMWDFFVKEDYIRRIWNGEDLEEDEDEEGETEEDENGQDRNRNEMQEGGVDGNNGLRRRRRGGQLGQNNEAANGGNERMRRRRTLVDGGIRRPPQEGGALGLLHDLRYFVFGFFLSLLPTWRPEVVVEEDENAQQQGAAGVVAAGNGNEEH
uniref:Uncharacterized protein n=1 Tax=Ditylum brightwellii TaxID=49249 RepID=A0A7S1YW93_9STRA|mmetsp:Transcript_19020/g.28380  ORF Transcript_19020/g.28380 Transcript_19020/m.28380 type:complete len:707 (+) Transcript_19020:70-2190(+)